MTFDPRQPFTFADGVAAGWTRARLRTCTRLAHGVLLDPMVEINPTLRAKGALLGCAETAYVSHATAARLLGLPVPELPFEHVTVLADPDRRRRAGRICHVRPDGDVWQANGIRVSSPSQLWSDLTPHLGLVDRVVLGDAILKREWPLHPVVHDLAARLIRPGVASPMETRARLLIRFAGLPEPEVDHVVRDERGEPIRQDDLYYPTSRTVVQFDGRHHIEREKTWQKDIGRREDAESTGVRFVVLTASDIYRTPSATIARIWRVLTERGEPHLPRVLRREWELHFRDRTSRSYGRS